MRMKAVRFNDIPIGKCFLYDDELWRRIDDTRLWDGNAERQTAHSASIYHVPERRFFSWDAKVRLVEQEKTV